MRPLDRAAIKDAVALALVVLTGAILRIPLLFSTGPGGIAEKPLWYDEAYSALFASQGPVGAFLLSGADTTPGLYVGLLSLWAGVFGDSTTALAAFSFLTSVGSLVLIFAVGREFFGERAGLIAAFLTAIDPLHLRFATEVRAYSLLFLIALAYLLFLHRMLERRGPFDGVLWAAAALAGFYAHYTFLLLFVPTAAYALYRLRRRVPELRRFLARSGAVALGFLPQVLIFKRWSDPFPPADGPSSFFSRGFGHGDLTTVLTFFSTIFGGERMFFPATVLGALGALAAGAVIGALLVMRVWSRRDDERHRLLAAALFGGIAASQALGFIFAPRYYLMFAGPALLLVAAAVAGLRRGRMIAALAAVALATAGPLALAYETPPAEAYKYYGPAFAETLAREARPGDLVLVDHFTEVLFRRYDPGPVDVKLFFPKGGANVTDLGERFRWVDYDLIGDEDLPLFEELVNGHRRVWTVEYEPASSSIQDPRGLRRRWFEERFRRAETLTFPAGDGRFQRMTLVRYERP